VPKLNYDTPPPAPPLIFFMPGIGEVESRAWEPFGHIVRAIPLSYFDWTELVKPETTFADLISHLKTQIQSQVSGEGPLDIVGYSIGGPLAYACVEALQAEGRSINSLTILDGRTTGSPPTTLRTRWNNFTTFQVRAGLASVIAKVLTRERFIPLLRRLSPWRHAWLPFRFGDYVHTKIKMQLMVRMFLPWWTSAGGSNSRLATPTYLFRSEQHEPDESEGLGWSAYCSDLTIIHVAGSHLSMLAPENFGRLCGELARVLAGGIQSTIATDLPPTPSTGSLNDEPLRVR